MAPSFGTSGLRGLAADLTPALVADHVRAFAAACPTGTGLYVGRDLRPSSPGISDAVIATALLLGLDVTDCGTVPTPALALAAIGGRAAAIMVTGSHVPADRNGLKFYRPDGEIGKADEAAILRALSHDSEPAARPGRLSIDEGAGLAWVARCVDAFGPTALAGRRIGVWTHSAVGRDLLLRAMRGLGAETVELGRSETFLALDTEAVPDRELARIRAWTVAHGLDAVVSTDGDGDRPLLADEAGQVVPGDILGQITARALEAETVVTPITSNSGVTARSGASRVIRTRIGSPFVIAAMQETSGRVVGYEANGGFLLGFAAPLHNGTLAPLVTRDSLLPLIVPLVRSVEAGGLAALVAAEPARFTAADRLRDIPIGRSRALLADLAGSATQVAFLANLGEDPDSVDKTDGLRLTCASGRVVHVRPSGNAPELRLYVEAESPDLARETLRRGLVSLRRQLAQLDHRDQQPET